MKTKKFLALAIVLAMCLGMLAACGNGGNKPGEEPGDKEENNTPLVVGYAPFSSKFSPFFAATAYDQDVASMTQAGLLTSDRTGAIILKGVEAVGKLVFKVDQLLKRQRIKIDFVKAIFDIFTREGQNVFIF